MKSHSVFWLLFSLPEETYAKKQKQKQNKTAKAPVKGYSAYIFFLNFDGLRSYI